jgi:enoyl-CoA hydratase/carnithine racemase
LKKKPKDKSVSGNAQDGKGGIGNLVKHLDYHDLLVDRSESGVAVIRLNRPHHLNALTQRTRAELATAFRNVNEDPEIGAVVLTGSGERAFAAGQDLYEARDFTPEAIDGWIDSFIDAYDAIMRCDKPSIAAVNGYALGSALQLALLCDFRIGSDRTRVGMPEIDDGVPCITGTWTLYEVIGRTRTTDLILTGRILDAGEALAWGLLNSVVAHEELLSAATEQAERLAKKPRTAMRLNKKRLADLLVRERASAAEYAKFAHAETYRSGEAQEAIASFISKAREGRAT